MEKERISSLSSDNEGQEKNKKMKSKLGLICFILALVPIVLIILYGFIKGFLISYLFLMIWYGNLVNYVPYISLILSVISIVLIKRKNIKGMGFAISGAVISLFEIIIFFIIIPK